MLRSLKIAIVLLLVALIPARAIGSVTISICASQQEQAVVQHHDHADHAGHAKHTEHDQHGEHESGDGSHACGYCAAHCAGVAFVVPTDLVRVDSPVRADRIPFGSGSEPAARIFRLDRPPLVS